MANVTVEDGNCIVITGLDADWVAGTDTQSATYRIQSITFIASADGDRCILRNREVTTGGTIFDTGVMGDISVYGSKHIEYFPHPVKVQPVFDQSDQTINTAANAKIIIRHV